MATRIYIAAEATDLCPREHELGTYGLPRLCAFWDGRACGTSEAQPSFPRPRWRPFSVSLPPLGGEHGELTLKLVEADPLQPRPQAPFCYGSVSVSSSELQPVTYRTVVISKPLERAPGKYGQLSLELSLQPLADNVRAAPSAALHLAHPTDWCGVLRFAADFGELQGRWSMEAACSADGKVSPVSPSSGFISWTAEGEATDVKELFIVERDVVFSAHASCANLTAKCVKRLSRMRGPGGSQCNMFVEAHPEPVPLEIVGVKQPPRPPRMHLRFFPADFLRPRAGMPCGISLRFTLAAAPPGLELPLVIYVPSSCFSSVPGMPGVQEEASFCISHIGDCAEVCLMDPSKLLGRSLWRLSANFSSPDFAESQSFLDVLSLKLHVGDERVLTMPLGDHAIVLRLLPSTLRLDVPRPVFGLFLPPAEAAEELRLHGAEQGEVAGIFVHSLAVHSPHVRCCFISAGPDPGTLFYPLPHMGGKVFIPAQPNENGKIVAYAFLPDFGYHAMAETAVGDACCQLHWVFNEGSKTAVLAAALITIARWPVSEGLSSASISIRVMQTSVPEQASSLLAPLHITLGSEVFTWSGKDGEHEAILSAAGNGMEVQCGEAVTSSFSLPELLLAQSALGFTYEEPQEAESEESYSEEEQAAPKKLVFDDKQGMLVPTSASDSEDSREAKARRARHRRAEIRKRPRRVEALAPGNLSLPVIVEERQGNQSAMAFCFLPVRVQHVSERPMLQGALDAAMHRIQGPDRETAGVILLQQFSAFARLDAHKDPSCQGCWEPVHALSLTATGFPGVAARASCRTAVHSFRGCAASWGVVTSLKQSPPHILKMRFATPPGQTHLDVQIEFRFTCSCGEACTFTAFGQVQMTALWQPIDVHLAIRKDQGVIAAGHLGAAFARLLLCPSQICTQPGLLTLELQPLYPGGPGVSELLDMETNLVRSGFYGPAMHEVPAGLRMAVDKAGGPALILDGRPDDFTAAGRAQRQLCLELGPEDALTDLRLELQALTGSRRFLRSMLLAALGPLGDTAVMAFHIHFGPRCSLALLCSFEAQRHALQLRQAKQTEMPIPAKPAESVPLEDPWRSSQQRRVSQALQRRRPEPGGTPRRERAQRAKGGAVTTGWRRSTKSHPFLERGPHHWLTDKCPYPVQRTEARRVLQTWTQEMGRQRPASAPRSKGPKGCGSPVAVPVRRNLPPDWDEKAEAKDGPKYRAEFIGRQKQKIFQLREDLQRCRVSKERMDQQMSHLRRLLRQAQQELDPKASHPRGGATKIKTIRSLRSKSQSGAKGEGSSTAEQRDESKQVCLRCEKAIPPEGRFCGGCFPGVLEEALQLREKVGKQLVQAASLRHKLDGQKREEAKLEARKCDLEARLFASEAGVQDSNTEPAQMVLATMAQLRSLRRDDEARSRLAAEQLEVLSQREAASTAALEEANARLKKANDEYDALEARLRKGDKKVQTLLGEIEKLSSPMRNAGGATTVLHQGVSGGLRLPIDHPVVIRASEMS